jgi:hypothetical protein
MRDDLQSQIDELKLKLATKDKQIEALKTQTLNTQQTTATAATRIHEIVNMGHPTAISRATDGLGSSGANRCRWIEWFL